MGLGEAAAYTVLAGVVGVPPVVPMMVRGREVHGIGREAIKGVTRRWIWEHRRHRRCRLQ